VGLDLTRVGLLDALGWAGSALLVVSVMQTRILRLRWLNLCATLILLIFNIGIKVWPMVAMNAVLAIINVWFIVRLTRERGTNAYAVLPVALTDAYLRHFLTIQARDIAAFFPNFRPDQSAGRRAFLVQHGHETAGVVVVRDLGNGVGQVELDYVTPAFRDFTPGEYVYRTSTVLTDLGLRRILTPAGMVAPYYDRLGFRREGDHFALDLA
jgi:hypothetical protein